MESSALDPNNDRYTLLIVDDDPLVAEGVAMSLVEPGRRVIVCHDVEAGTMVIEQDRVDVVIADIRFGGEFSYQGFDFIDLVKRESPKTQVILMTGAGTDGLEAEAKRKGATGFLRKPFETSELEMLLRSASGFANASSIIHVPGLDSMLEDKMIRMHFQPIVTLPDRTIAGFEALTRIGTDSLMRNPANLFDYATRVGRILELEAHCLSAAIHVGKPLTTDSKLFLNVNPSSFEHPSIVSTVERALDSAGVSPDRVVLEITEQGAIRSKQSLEQIRKLKSLGVEFALDDIGVAFSHLPYIDEIEPSWIKISQLFGTDFEADPTKIKIVNNLADLAHVFGSKLILEGVETEATAMAAAAAGIGYAQGYLFSRAEPIEHWNSLRPADLFDLSAVV